MALASTHQAYWIAIFSTLWCLKIKIKHSNSQICLVFQFNR